MHWSRWSDGSLSCEGVEMSRIETDMVAMTPMEAALAVGRHA